MDTSAIVQLILSVLSEAPALIAKAVDAYESISGDLSESDIDKIEAALTRARGEDAAATAAADEALTAARSPARSLP